MGLYLLEIPTRTTARAEVDHLLERLLPAIGAADATTVETRVTGDLKRLFTVVESSADDAVDALRASLAAADIEVDDLAAVRLVGAELDDVDRGSSPGYLVEWDLPEDLTMDAYLARKRAASPRYAEVPEVTFQRTYVREDLGKCLCFYDAPCADDVYRARDVVGAPVDRFHELA